MANNRLEFYVLNHDINKDKIEPYNIFNNVHVLEASQKALRKYIRSPKNFKVTTMNNNTLYGFDALCEEIRKILMWQEWSRCEYEIKVGGLFSKNMEKWDCYGQALPNIRTITRDILYQYRHK